MTPKKMLDLVLRLSNFQIGDSAKRSSVLDWMNVAKQEIVDYEGVLWDFLFTSFSLNTVAATPTYTLDATALDIISFWNVTENRPMVKRSLEWIEKFDPDEDTTSSPRRWIILGWDSTSQGWLARIHPTPDIVYALKYSAYNIPADFTDTDTSQFGQLGWPKKAEPSLMHWTAELMLQQEGMTEDAEVQRRSREKAISGLIRRNTQTIEGKIPIGIENIPSTTGLHIESLSQGGHDSSLF